MAIEQQTKKDSRDSNNELFRIISMCGIILLR